MEFADAIILGLVQGITEFLPISSSGHLVLFRDWLSITAVDALAYDAVLHFATTLSVILYFWSDIWVLIQTLLRKLGRLPVNQRELTLLSALLVGTIPAALVGFFFESIIENYLHTTFVVAIVLLLGGLFFLYAEWRYYTQPPHGVITVRRGFQIGLFQVLALVPGFSRSGATIAGAMLLGLTRYEATRFSFLLAIPITLGAGSKKLIDLLKGGEAVDWLPILIGSVTAFFTALIVIHFFLAFVRRYTLWPFVWYSFILSSLVWYVWFIS